MVKRRHPSKPGVSKRAKNKTQTFKSTSIKHPIFQVEDVMELIFDYLDIPSLKQCRLICSSWTLLATRLLMKRTFFNMLTAAIDDFDFCMNPLLSSVKVNAALLSRLSSTIRYRSLVSFHWKSVSLSVVPSAKRISSFALLLDSIFSNDCPRLTNMQIHFKDDFSFKKASETQVQLLWKSMQPEFSTLVLPHCKTLVPKFNPNFLSFTIRSLHLTLSDSTNFSEVSEFMKRVLRKNVVPQLEELLIELPDDYQSDIESDDIHASVTSAMIIRTLSDSTELGFLRVLKIQRKLLLGCDVFQFSKAKELILSSANGVNKSHLAETRLDLSSKLRELQWGSGYVLLHKEKNANFHSFFPGVLTTPVASVLETLHLGGIYLASGTPLAFPSVDFPHMPCLRKLTVEAVTILSIQNFSTIFEKAQSIKEFSVKNSVSVGCWDKNSFLEVSELIEFEKWECTIGEDGYPSLRSFKLGDWISVKSSSALQKLSQIFPNVEVFHFTLDDWSQCCRRKPMKSKWDYSEAEVRLQNLKKIEEGLKNLKSLRQLTVTFLPYFSANGLLSHLLNCTTELPGLQLYDFRQGDDPDSILHKKHFSEKYLNEMKQKLFQLKTSMQFSFVLHNYKLHNQEYDGKKRQHSMSSVMNELFLYAEKESIFNFRHSVK